MDSHATSKCSVCDDPAAEKCGGCKTNYYCSKKCQHDDWSKHKGVCKDIRLENSLERAATIVQLAYLKFRENTWDTPIIKVEDTADTVVVYDGATPSKPKYFIDFPRHLVKIEEAKMAVLCMLACNEPLAQMHTMLCGLLRDPFIKVDEVEVNLQNIPRKTTAVHPNGYRQDNWPGYSHFLLRITSTKTKTQWALDIAGGQFGICTALWKWADYASRYLDANKVIKMYPYGTNKVIKMYPYGTNKAALDKLGRLDGNPSMVYGLIGDMAGAMDEAVTAFEENANFKLSALLLLENDEFNRQKTALLEAIDLAVQTYKKVMDKQIAGKHRAVQAYERKYPGLSSRKCTQMTQQLFGEGIAVTEPSGSTSSAFGHFLS